MSPRSSRWFHSSATLPSAKRKMFVPEKRTVRPVGSIPAQCPCACRSRSSGRRRTRRRRTARRSARRGRQRGAERLGHLLLPVRPGRVAGARVVAQVVLVEHVVADGVVPHAPGLRVEAPDQRDMLVVMPRSESHRGRAARRAPQQQSEPGQPDRREHDQHDVAAAQRARRAGCLRQRDLRLRVVRRRAGAGRLVRRRSPSLPRSPPLTGRPPPVAVRLVPASRWSRPHHRHRVPGPPPLPVTGSCVSGATPWYWACELDWAEPVAGTARATSPTARQIRLRMVTSYSMPRTLRIERLRRDVGTVRPHDRARLGVRAQFAEERVVTQGLEDAAVLEQIAEVHLAGRAVLEPQANNLPRVARHSSCARSRRPAATSRPYRRSTRLRADAESCRPAPPVKGERAEPRPAWPPREGPAPWSSAWWHRS